MKLTAVLAGALSRKKGREGILDEAYNRYTFNDEDLPVWFKSEVRSQDPLLPTCLLGPVILNLTKGSLLRRVLAKRASRF